MIKVAPKNITGQIALVLSGFSIAFGFLMTSLVGQYLGGFEAIMIMLLFGIISYVLLVKSIFFEKDRSILSWIIFGLITIVLGFWLLFAAGEIIFPH